MSLTLDLGMSDKRMRRVAEGILWPLVHALYGGCERVKWERPRTASHRIGGSRAIRSVEFEKALLTGDRF